MLHKIHAKVVVLTSKIMEAAVWVDRLCTYAHYIVHATAEICTINLPAKGGPHSTGTDSLSVVCR